MQAISGSEMALLRWADAAEACISRSQLRETRCKEESGVRGAGEGEKKNQQAENLNGSRRRL